MAVVPEDLTTSSPLSPEQRALLAYWGGEESLHRAVNILRLEVEATLAPERLRSALEAALQNHGALNAVIGQEPGFQGLRLRSPEQESSPQNTPLTWQLLEAQSADDIGPIVPSLASGKPIHAILVQRNDGPATLILAVNALLADRGSLLALAEQMSEQMSQQIAEPMGQGLAHPGDGQEFFQYFQYLQWRDELDADAEAFAGRDYWQEYLGSADSLTAPRLAYRHAGSYSPQEQRRCVRHGLKASALAGVIEAAAATGVQAEALLQTAWWALLARLTGGQRYMAGWQHDCRLDYEVMQGAVGVFDKVLPLVIEGRADEPFSTWLARMNACCAAHTQVQEYCPVDTLTAAQHLSIGFAYQPAPASNSAAALRILESPGPMPCFELALSIDAAADGSATLSLHAAASLYPQPALESLLEQYVLLLQGAVEQPDSPVSALPWLSESSQQALRNIWQGPSVDFGPRNIAQHIAHWAQATPDAPAVVTRDKRLNYAALNARANRLAHWMRAQGIEAGAWVALDLPRSPDCVVAILAAWRIGAAYLPLEPAWPAARKAAVLADARPALVLCAMPSPDAEAGFTVAIGDIDLSDFSAEPPEYSPQPGDLAYVLYTSGSTGQPKGVMIEQRQLLNYIAAASFAMNLSDCRCWGLLNTLAADLGNTALFGALFNGAGLAVADDNEIRDGAAFARFIIEFAIDAIKIVPSHLKALLADDTARLPHTVVLGGEAASRALLERLAQISADSVVYNHYGPTETTVGVMAHRVSRIEAQPDALPLSQVLANNYVYILDEKQQPAPVGARGELYIGGAQLCRGYLNRDPGGAFIADPWQPGKRLYRSGDLAWVLPQGAIRLAGRCDQQIKVRGFRVEPAEVESAIQSHARVRQAAVIARGDRHDTALIAFIVSDAIDADLWREQAARYLPEHMRPADYMVLDELPRLPNGKIDRLALAAMPTASPANCQGAEPSSPLEAILAQSMADLLNREFVAADADFFALGGHSLLVIRLVARIRKLFQIDIEPGLVFDHSTAQALALALCDIDHAERLNQLARAAQA